MDLVTLPAHTSHALQPLDVSIFKTFKQHFREYRDFWSSKYLNEAASKDTMAQWVSLALRKALSSSNIKKGFSATGIFPLNFNAVDEQLRPSEVFNHHDGDIPQVQRGEQPRGREEQEHEADAQDEDFMHVVDNADTAGEGKEPKRGLDDQDRSILRVQSANLEADLAEVPDSVVEHFFVDRDPADPGASEE